MVSDRTAFDGLLLDAARRAGAELVAARAADVRRVARGFEIDTADGQTLGAPMIVGADGANSLVRRRLTRPFTRRELSIATGFFVHGATSDEILLEFVADPPGYIWSFPRPNHLAVGICAPADAGVSSAALRTRTRAWIERTGIGRGARLEPYSWPIPSLTAGDFDRLAIAGPGWCLVGDAAGVVDPITREGIFFALQSATFAADAITGSPIAGEHAYRERMQMEVLDELRRAARLKDVLLPAALHAPADRRPRPERPDPRRDGRPHRRRAELSRPQVAPRAHVRGWLRHQGTRGADVAPGSLSPGIFSAAIVRRSIRPARALARPAATPSREWTASRAEHRPRKACSRAGTASAALARSLSSAASSARRSVAWNERPPVTDASSTNIGGRFRPVAIG